MPKTLPALVAVAVIAFSIGFNTARYPIFWEMVGASGHLPEEAVGAESATAPQPAKADDLIASIPSDNPDPVEKGTGPICRNGPEGASHKLDLPPFPQTVFSDQAAAGKAELVGVESSPSYVQLVPVPGNLFNGNGLQEGDQYPGVRRLPPVYEAAPIPAGRYAAEYPQSPVTIYPSTGVE